MKPPVYYKQMLKAKHMKPLSTLPNIVSSMAALALMAACQTVATNDAELAASKKEFLLAQSGFKVITVTTPKQQQAINGPVAPAIID